MQKLEPTNFDEESLQIMTFHESLQWSEPGKHNYRGVEISGKRMPSKARVIFCALAFIGIYIKMI